MRQFPSFQAICVADFVLGAVKGDGVMLQTRARQMRAATQRVQAPDSSDDVSRVSISG